MEKVPHKSKYLPRAGLSQQPIAASITRDVGLCAVLQSNKLSPNVTGVLINKVMISRGCMTALPI